MFKNADLVGLAAGGDPPARLANPDEEPLERYAVRNLPIDMLVLRRYPWEESQFPIL